MDLRRYGRIRACCYRVIMDIHSKQVTDLPNHSGVYLYKDNQGVVIYVGKAIDLQKRVKQYFENSAAQSMKTKQLVDSIATIDHISTVSEFDALLLEAKLISTYQPKYNMIAKDDKSPIYISIPLHDTLPIISLVRKSQRVESLPTDVLIGPFQSARVAKQILSTIRTIIPFCRQKIRKGRPCFYTHLELCHPCPSAIVALDPLKQKESTRIYRNNIFLLKNVLQGKSIATRTVLEQSMRMDAKQGKFELAAYTRNQLQHLDDLLQTHFDPSVYTTISQDIGETIAGELADLKRILLPYYPSLQTLNRIECIDISQSSGSQAVGSLVVLDHGIINTSLYRRFAIRDISGQNDAKMIEQVITRRFRHPEWQFPDLLIVDGGKVQLKAAYEAISSGAVSIPIIGLAKRFEHIVVQSSGKPTELRIPMVRPGIHIVQRIRDESHRFAHQYHVLKRKEAYLPKI